MFHSCYSMESHLNFLEVSISVNIEFNSYVKLVAQLFYVKVETYSNLVGNKGREIEIYFHHNYFSQFSSIETQEIDKVTCKLSMKNSYGILHYN